VTSPTSPTSKRSLDHPNLAGLDALIAPSSVAVIGASDDPDRIGGRPLSYMKAAEFRGQIFPVNPNRPSVQGITAYPSIRDVPAAPDVVVVAVQAPLVPGVLEECAERGSKAAVVFSAGFAETGEEGRQAQRRLSEIGSRTGMRILGPNCLGVFNARTGWMGTFASPIRQASPLPGPISIASQSGAVGSELFSHLRRRGLATGTWITTGNEADVDVADAIAFLVEDATTEVVVAYAEGVGRGRAFRTALERAAELGKPVIFMKTGRSQTGAAAVQSHTAALAGEDRVYDALFRQLGVIRVRTFEDLVHAAYISTFPRRPKGKRLGLVTISGGVGVQMADAATDAGLEVPELSDTAQQELKALVPFASGRNPGDVTAQVFNDLGLVSRYLRIMLADGDFDAAVLFLTMVVASEDTSRRLIAELDTVMAEFADVALIISLLAPAPIIELYEAAGYPVFSDPTRAVEAAAVLCRRSESRATKQQPASTDIPAGALRMRDLRAGGGTLSEDESMRIVEGWGVPCAARRKVHSEDEAVSAARKLGGNVALKIAAPPVQHKSDVGGVLVDVEGESAVRNGYRTLVQRGAESVLVAQMAPAGVETVVGVSHDPTFGPVVMVGLGGVLVEVLDDVALRLAPFGVDEARRMIDELKGARLFHGFRGAPPADVDALADLLARISAFAAAEEGSYASVDLNPVRVLPRGQGVVVLDALVELPRPSTGASSV
jgi:acyl-CoA synthetase (NDP forming)